MHDPRLARRDAGEQDRAGGDKIMTAAVAVHGLQRAAPDPGRDADRHVAADRPGDGGADPGIRVAEAGADEDDPGGAAVDGGIDEAAVGAEIDRHQRHVDLVEAPSGGGRRGGAGCPGVRPIGRSPARAVGEPDGSESIMVGAKAYGSLVCTLARPQAGNTRPRHGDQHPAIPGGRVGGQGERRGEVGGAVGRGSSAVRWAPVSTIGRGSSWVAASRAAVSSSVSVPCVTTIPATSGRPSTARIASTSVRRSAWLSANELARSSESSSTSGSPGADSPASNPAASSVGRWPCPDEPREAMVPPVLISTTVFIGPSKGRAPRAPSRALSLSKGV